MQSSIRCSNATVILMLIHLFSFHLWLMIVWGVSAFAKLLTFPDYAKHLVANYRAQDHHRGIFSTAILVIAVGTV